MAVYTSDGSLANTQLLVNQAVTGDTVIIPNGTWNWNGQLTINKSITFKGQTPGSAILNNLFIGTMIVLTSGTDGHITMSGLNLVQVSQNGAGIGTIIACDRSDTSGPPGNQYTVLVNNCTFDNSQIYNYSVSCLANGIIFWQCTFIGNNGGLGGVQSICKKYGYGLWNTPSTMGALDTTGLNNTYIENCTLLYAGADGITNFDDNARGVVRYCTVQDAQIANHGQESSIYGIRHLEVYNNTFRNVNAQALNLTAWVSLRGGTMAVTNNSFDLPPPNQSSFWISVFSISRGINDAVSSTFCPTPPPSGYPAPRQSGWGWSSTSTAYWGTGYDAVNPGLLFNGISPGAFLPDGTGAIIDPVYIWNNTGAGAAEINPAQVYIKPFSPDSCGNNLQVTDFVQQNREFYIGTARPGWTPYTYPHPLTQAAPPTILEIKVTGSSGVNNPSSPPINYERIFRPTAPVRF